MGRKRRGDPVSGWLVLDKPVGPTSTTAVNRCRWLLNAQKAGHAGTLDPLASGILPIAFGEATKCINFLTDATKTYRFTIRFGTSTTTDDEIFCLNCDRRLVGRDCSTCKTTTSSTTRDKGSGKIISITFSIIC